MSSKGFRALFLIMVLAVSTPLYGLQSMKPERQASPAWQNVNMPAFYASAGIQLAGFSTAIVYLHQAWYKNHPRSSFHFHNDMGDWLQMDKMGHMVPGYQLNLLSAEAYRVTGLDSRRSAWFGAASSIGFLTAIEVLDGFSEEWGFSVGDMVANLIGSAAYVGQELGWGEQRIQMKWSHRASGLAHYRPDLLGANRLESILKDYNGDTYWISFNLQALAGKHEVLPSWLSLAIGYSAHGMLGSSSNPAEHNGRVMPDMPRYRQWFLAPDLDLSRIQTDSGALRTILNALNVLKFPAPAVEYNRVHGWRFHLIYF